MRAKDLPHGPVPLRVWVRKRRFVCAERRCERGSFTETSAQLPAHRPPASQDVGGVAEQVGGAGILVPAADRDGLEAAVRTLVDDPTLRRRLGRAGQARVTELYGIEDFDRQVVGLVDRTRRRNR